MKLSYDEDGISIVFPDLPGCYPCADKGDTDIALPAWLAAKADEDGVNCSRIFQNALMVYPGVHSTTK